MSSDDEGNIVLLERLRTVFTPVAPALAAAGIVGWLVTIVLLMRGGGDGTRGLLAIVIGVSIGAVAVPVWKERISAEIRQTTQLHTAHTQLADLLDTYLDGSWTLYHGVSTKTTSLLVGNTGIFLLDLHFNDSATQVKGHKWLQRDDEDQWQLVKNSPSRRAAKHAAELKNALGDQFFVQPRVVWASDSVILLDEPAVPVWWLAQDESIAADLRTERTALADETISLIHSKLEKIREAKTRDNPLW